MSDYYKVCCYCKAASEVRTTGGERSERWRRGDRGGRGGEEREEERMKKRELIHTHVRAREITHTLKRQT